ncbi:MAG: hypothetical protein IKG27_05820 [Bacilli bacterium]|nr:hypothetical protein [Bacilli bacterium]
MKENYDFYSYGARIAEEAFEKCADIAKELGEKYGRDAVLEFQCGVSSFLESNSMDLLGEDIPEMPDKGFFSGRIDFSKDLRNESYFGGSGVSHIRDSEGRFNEPKPKKGRK